MKVGSTVICRSGNWVRPDLLDEYGIKRPNLHQFLTVRTIEVYDGDVFLRFEEVLNPDMYFKDGCYEIQFYYGVFEVVDTVEFDGMVMSELNIRNIGIE